MHWKLELLTQFPALNAKIAVSKSLYLIWNLLEIVLYTGVATRELTIVLLRPCIYGKEKKIMWACYVFPVLNHVTSNYTDFKMQSSILTIKELIMEFKLYVSKCYSESVDFRF